MKKMIMAALFLAVNYTSLAQGVVCDCEVVYDDLIQKLEENYIGLAQMRVASQSRDYDTRKMQFKKKVNSINRENCTRFLQAFLSYFKDGHLFVYETPKYSEEEITQFKRRIKDSAPSRESILQQLDLEKKWKKKTRPDDIIGKWTDGQSELVMIKDKGYYKAYIFNSTSKPTGPVELKAQFKATATGYDGVYYSDNYSPRYVEGNIYKEGTLFVFTGAHYWGKTDAESIRETAMINKQEINLPVIQKLDNDNTLFSIPSFLVDPQKFFSVVMENIEILKNTRTLIFDIRGNVGGDAIYMSFLESYATRPLESSQGLVLASKETKAYFERLSQDFLEVYGPVVGRIEANMGTIIDGPEYPEKTFPPSEFNIKNVAILMDEGCMSAAESFILHSLGASSKVKTFGSHSGGVIDYTSVNTLKLKSGDQNIYFGYPTSTYHKKIPENGYNETGIAPEVLIDKKEKDKLQFIINYYKNR